MKRYFLVDTENIGNKELPGADKLTKEDTVILFHNEGGKIMNLLVSIADTPAATEVKKMNVHQKNAMDFQICTYLGLLVAQNGSDAEYYIVSKDKGYVSAIEFVKNNSGESVVIKEVVSIEGRIQGEEAHATIDTILSGFSRKVRHVAKEGLIKTATPAQYHNFLQNALPKDGKNIYQILKGQYSELRLAAYM